MIGFKKIGGGGATTAAQVSYLNGDIVNVQEALDSLLYVNPKINFFDNGFGIVEKGAVLETVDLQWGFNKPMVSASINLGIGDVSGLEYYEHVDQNITQNRTYTLTASDGTNSVSRNTTITFKNKMYWGTSPISDLNTINLLNLQRNKFADGRAIIDSINGDGKYIYVAFPATFGVPQWVVNGFAFTALDFVIRPFTNSLDFTENYYIGRLSTVQFGVLTIETK